jgi:hypothetical protein
MLAFAGVPVWIACDLVGWDVAIYRSAIGSLRAGHDPYADATAVQDAFHRDLALHPNAVTPFSYVYSPITLPLLRAIGGLPVRFSGTAYWLVYIVSALTLVWVGMQATEDAERRYFVFLAPAALFLPGMLYHDTVLSGNVAFILYAGALGGAVLGWRRGEWRWCYVAILVASCFKVPLLSLLAIPVFSARRQWPAAGATAALGIALFAVQPIVWPSLFQHFLRAVELQFSYNRDFGCSPAGLLSDILFVHGAPYSTVGTVFYLAYAVPLFGFLLRLSREFLRGRFSLQQWLPVLLTGVILLDPRVMQYDVVPLTIPLLLIGWRVVARFTSPAPAVALLCVAFAAVNLFAARDLVHWKIAEGGVLVVFFAAGSWNLIRSYNAREENGKPFEQGSLNRRLNRAAGGPSGELAGRVSRAAQSSHRWT